VNLKDVLEKASFLIPALLLIFTFVIYPTIATILLSFNINLIPGVNLVEGSTSLENYVKVLTSEEFINPTGLRTSSFPMGAIVHNVIWILIHLPATTILGLLLAVFLQNIKGSSIIRSMIFLGMVIPMVVGALMIAFSFNKDMGIVPSIFKCLGILSLYKTWTSYPDTALLSLIIGSIWLWTGFSVTLYSAGLASIPKELIEAAKIDGAPFRVILFKIIIPLLRPVTVTVVAMTILWVLKIFDIVYVATRGGPGGASMVMALLMWDYFARMNAYTLSATIATLLTIIVLPVVILWIRYATRGE